MLLPGIMSYIHVFIKNLPLYYMLHYQSHINFNLYLAQVIGQGWCHFSRKYVAPLGGAINNAVPTAYI
jgi:hypothetical protein